MVFKRFNEDIDAFMARDPAARSRIEIVLCYPGFQAIVVFRVARFLWRRRMFLLARMVSHLGRLATGIEIHPGATVGRRLVIDHGTGVVIGETAEIGNDVTLYQGVTLGGISPSVDSRAQVAVKRHPTLQAGVIIGSGAQILGPIVIGEGARVGANSVVTRDVAAGVTAVGIPAHVVAPRDRDVVERFSAYGTLAGGCPDPMQATIDVLTAQVMALTQRLDAMQARTDGRSDPASPPSDGTDGGAETHIEGAKQADGEGLRH
ncbi:MAG: serine O-acetyltransferase [Rhodospirillales bacterium]|nr:serine O-acetyltransferase [Rhodospirillales bacterium]